MSKRINAKIGYMNNCDLPPLKNQNGGHYVYIRKKQGKVNVHTITSIEHKAKDNKHTIPLVINTKTGEIRYVSEKKLRDIRNGNLYPIPKNECNLSLWSGMNKKPIRNVDESKIKNIDSKKIRRKHKFFFK